MNYKNLKHSGPRQERGITIFVVAVVIVAVLGMAALAIDLIALYVAHGQAQRAADAAALAGAKMFVSSGFTSNPSAWTLSNICQTAGPGAAAAANQQAEAIAKANSIAGQQVTVQLITCGSNLTTIPTNPTITVKVQQTGLPSYFAKVWGQTMNSVSATSTAEAYNPSGSTVPVQAALKPWLIPNCDPDATGCSPMINVTDGSIANSGAFIGEQIALSPTTLPSTPTKGQYYAMDIPVVPAPLCPSACDVSTQYKQNIACASQNPLTCGSQPVKVEQAPPADTDQATQCLIHATDFGLDKGQDAITPALGSDVNIVGGTENPNPSLQNVPDISRSDSIVSVPIYSGGNLCGTMGPCTTSATIVGFLQIGVNQVVATPDGTIQGVILNAAGCNPAAAPPPITGGGVSTVPIRLIGQ
jgi:Tfp pilus assembly protein PilX